MSALILRLPDDKHARLPALAQSRSTSVNRLLNEATTLVSVEFGAETRFRLRAARGAGKAERGLALLGKENPAASGRITRRLLAIPCNPNKTAA